MCEASQRELQQAHLGRLRAVGRYPGTAFPSQEHLAVGVYRSFVLDLLVEAGLSRRPLTLPFASIGPLFKGRSALMAELEAASRPIALVGQGGVGKSRVAIEYAWQEIGRRQAVLWISAASASALTTNLARLCEANAIDLPEHDATEEAIQRQAVLKWLAAHPGWLLILDNVDSNEAR